WCGGRRRARRRAGPSSSRRGRPSGRRSSLLLHRPEAPGAALGHPVPVGVELGEEDVEVPVEEELLEQRSERDRLDELVVGEADDPSLVDVRLDAGEGGVVVLLVLEGKDGDLLLRVLLDDVRLAEVLEEALDLLLVRTVGAG